MAAAGAGGRWTLRELCLPRFCSGGTTRLLRLGVVMLGSREAAEDAVQDAFVALHRHRSALRDPEAAEAYLRSAVLNRCRSWVRRQVTQRAARPLMLVRGQERSPEDTSVSREEAGSLVT